MTIDFFLSIDLIMHYFLLEISGYLDPNSAMAILTVFMGVIAGVGMTLKLYWHKLKLKLSNKDSK